MTKKYIFAKATETTTWGLWTNPQKVMDLTIKEILFWVKERRKNRKDCVKRHKGNELAIQFDKGELFMLDCIERYVKEEFR